MCNPVEGVAARFCNVDGITALLDRVLRGSIGPAANPAATDAMAQQLSVQWRRDGLDAGTTSLFVAADPLVDGAAFVAAEPGRDGFGDAAHFGADGGMPTRVADDEEL